jgi:hypothetical protein
MKIRIRQVYATERVLELESVPQGDKEYHEDLESYFEDLRSDTTQLPEFEDPRWREGWDLKSETIDLLDDSGKVITGSVTDHGDI